MSCKDYSDLLNLTIQTVLWRSGVQIFISRQVIDLNPKKRSESDRGFE
ncbi:hypothetical protein GS682_01725 [Nostoc sp. B(2019)]|nr:hypothetical protein [Nostoc sp. B(2019)]